MQVVGNNVQPKYDLELYKGFFMEEMTQNLLDFKGRLFFFQITRFLWEVSTVGSQEYRKIFKKII
jgi:hypothetical protein